MKNQQLTTALLTLVLPILGACSSPAILEANLASSPKTLQAQAAANIVPNAVWDATHVFNLGGYYYPGSTFATNVNGVNISVHYGNTNINFDFHAKKLQFEPGKQANTLTSRAFYYEANARAKITGTKLPNCTYSLGPQEFSVPANSITITFDPTYTADNYQYGYNPLSPVGKDWIHFVSSSTVEIVSGDAVLKSVCSAIFRGQTTTTYTPITLFRTTQPINPIIFWNNQISITGEFADPNLQDIAFGTFPSGGAHLWR
jgi:hypothetical protein